MGGGVHPPPPIGKLVPQVPAVGSTQHGVGPGNPGIADAIPTHVFVPQGTDMTAAPAAPAVPAKPVFPAVPAPVPPAPVAPAPDGGNPALPAAPAAPPVPLPPLLESLPHPMTKDAPSNPTENHRFIFLTSPVRDAAHRRSLRDQSSRALSMPRALRGEKGLIRDSARTRRDDVLHRAHAARRPTRNAQRSFQAAIFESHGTTPLRRAARQNSNEALAVAISTVGTRSRTAGSRAAIDSSRRSTCGGKLRNRRRSAAV